MDAKQAQALRAPFPAGVVGKLPKPYKSDSAKGTCRECGGYHGLPAAHLDFVGHAAATDRLLQVDPSWTWEPFAIGPDGLPALDASRNLWIRLTIAGVTRIGVGDGKSLKECIGDAIRNAAMRFGVALDLWAKEDLHAMDTERGTTGVPDAEPEQPAPATRTMSRPRAAAPAPEAPTDDAVEPEPLTDHTRKQMFAELTKHGITDAEKQRAGMGRILGHPIMSRADLTEDDGRAIVLDLQARAVPAPAVAPDAGPGPSDADWDAMEARP